MQCALLNNRRPHKEGIATEFDKEKLGTLLRTTEDLIKKGLRRKSGNDLTLFYGTTEDLIKKGLRLYRLNHNAISKIRNNRRPHKEGIATLPIIRRLWDYCEQQKTS